MTPNETAKPCPSTERKKPKVVILRRILGLAAALYRASNWVDGRWNWIKDHWQVLRDWFGDLW